MKYYIECFLYRINPGIQFSFTMLINYSASLKMRYHILKRLMSLTSNAGSTKECGIDFILDIFLRGRWPKSQRSQSSLLYAIIPKISYFIMAFVDVKGFITTIWVRFNCLNTKKHTRTSSKFLVNFKSITIRELILQK